MPVQLKHLSPVEVSLLGDESLAEWREKHTLPIPGREFIPLVRQGRWDGMWHPGKWLRQRGDQYEMRCSRGLAPRILQDLGEPLPEPVATDSLVETFYRLNQSTVDQLRDYQRRALDVVLKSGWGRVAYATNAGKGAVIALAARYAISQEVPVLVCCDELAVFDALKGEIRQWAGLTPFLLQAGVKEPPAGVCVTLAMVPTLAKRLEAELRDEDEDDRPWLEWMAKQGMLLLDEADKADAPRWKTVMTAAKRSWWRAGFSGSFPTDPYADLRLTDAMGPVLDRVKNVEMVKRGISARPLIELHGYDVTPAVFPLATIRGPNRRQVVYERTIIYNAERHAFVASLVQADTPTVVIVNRIEHGHGITRAIPGAVFLDGSASEQERLNVLEQFRSGEVMVLVVTKILDRGTNRLGHAADLIFAAGEGSPAQTLQRIGRGLRRAGGKEFLRLVDVMDRVAVQEQSDKRLKKAAEYLHGAARRRVQTYADEQFDVRIIP